MKHIKGGMNGDEGPIDEGQGENEGGTRGQWMKQKGQMKHKGNETQGGNEGGPRGNE